MERAYGCFIETKKRPNRNKKTEDFCMSVVLSVQSYVMEDISHRISL